MFLSFNFNKNIINRIWKNSENKLQLRYIILSLLLYHISHYNISGCLIIIYYTLTTTCTFNQHWVSIFALSCYICHFFLFYICFFKKNETGFYKLNGSGNVTPHILSLNNDNEILLLIGSIDLFIQYMYVCMKIQKM